MSSPVPFIFHCWYSFTLVPISILHSILPFWLAINSYITYNKKKKFSFIIFTFPNFSLIPTHSVWCVASSLLWFWEACSSMSYSISQSAADVQSHLPFIRKCFSGIPLVVLWILNWVVGFSWHLKHAVGRGSNYLHHHFSLHISPVLSRWFQYYFLCL